MRNRPLLSNRREVIYRMDNQKHNWQASVFSEIGQLAKVVSFKPWDSRFDETLRMLCKKLRDAESWFRNETVKIVLGDGK